MNFKEWKKWLGELPWSCKWFVIFILIRPVTDNFYSLKEISPLFSPLYILGILTPVFILLSFLSRRFPKKISSQADIPVRILILLILANGVILLAGNYSLLTVGEVIKSVTPFLLFFYLRHFIRSQRDLHGIFQTFLYACIFPGLVLLYENIFNPIAVEYLTEGRGGGSRIRGGYADVMSYAIFITGSFLIAAYYYLLKLSGTRFPRLSVRKMLVILGLCLLGLISIKQVSTWAVIVMLFVLFLASSIRNPKGIIFGLLIVLIMLPFVAQRLYDDQINPLIQKELAVANGETEMEYAFNGRVGRWERYIAIWSATPMVSKLMGVSTAGVKEGPVMISNGIHNDLIRMMFLSGILGLSLYLWFLYCIFRAGKQSRRPERFLIIGAVACILLHSMSALPLMYASYIYLLMAVFAYALLPNRLKYSHAATTIRQRPVAEVMTPVAGTV